MDKWPPIKNSFVSIKISPTNLVFELIIEKNSLISNEASWANLNAYKRIFNWQPFMHRVYSTTHFKWVQISHHADFPFRLVTVKLDQYVQFLFFFFCFYITAFLLQLP